MQKYDPVKTYCEFCGSQNIYKYHVADNGTQIFKCRNCKVQFMNPQYTDKHLANYYSTYIRDESKIEDELIKSHTYCLSLVEAFLPKRGNLLEIGSGHGYLLKVAEKRGWIPLGHEIDCESARKISAKIGMKMLCGEFTALEINNKFDAVIMLHVLEHLKDPVKHIKKINSVLNNSGILFIALPNIQSRSGLFKFGLEKLKIKRRNVAAYYDTDHHLWYYTPFTIRKFLEMSGFEIIRIYSGEKINLKRGKFVNYLAEQFFSKIFWHSSMGVIARKQ
jgi:2-polyprenyl-3-methyl-5-hydroxy-6-metoxy-1,4-benzoquinol methylase